MKHLLINPARTSEGEGDGEAGRSWVIGSHPDDAPGQQPAAGNAVVLASAFSEFIAASGRLESSYRLLQEEVVGLRQELCQQNAALSQSLAENKQMHRHLQQVVDSMPCGVVVVAEDGCVSMMNPESLRLLDLDGSLRGSSITVETTTAEPMTVETIAALSGIRLQTSPDSRRTQEFCIHDSTGNRWLEVRNRRLLAAEESSRQQTILILRDITAQRRDQQEREAGRKAMALAEITTMLAHEMRNPLASLELFGELIENDTNQRATWVSHLRAGIRTLSAITNNVLSFHGSGLLALTPVPLAALIDKAIQFVQPLADQAAVSLEWLGHENSGIILGNECALQQVILNLVSNAIRHTPAGGTVTVSLRAALEGHPPKATPEAVIEFSDTGCGIRPDQAEHIFEPGFSGCGDTSGLGLAVCRQIMKQHQGSICLLPSQQPGARFELRFPVLAYQQAQA